MKKKQGSRPANRSVYFLAVKQQLGETKKKRPRKTKDEIILY